MVVIKRAQRSHATRDLQLPPNGLLHVLSLRPALSSKPKLKPALNSKLTLHTGAVHALSLPFLKAVLKELEYCWKARDQNSLPHLASGHSVTYKKKGINSCSAVYQLLQTEQAVQTRI